MKPMTKESIIAELEELGFEDISIKDGDFHGLKFVYRDVSVANPQDAIIILYREERLLWKYGIELTSKKLRVCDVDGIWKLIDYMPIADLMMLYK